MPGGESGALLGALLTAHLARTPCGEDASTHLPVVFTEPTVRAELMEQVPHIALFCQENRPAIPYAFSKYLLPIVVRYLADQNNQVGRPCPHSCRNVGRLVVSLECSFHLDLVIQFLRMTKGHLREDGAESRRSPKCRNRQCQRLLLPCQPSRRPPEVCHWETSLPGVAFLFPMTCYDTVCQVLSLQSSQQFLSARLCQL